jgi:hypothetical protein
MHFRAILFSLLAMCVATNPSLAAACEVNCSFSTSGPTQEADQSHAMPVARSAAASQVATHACCAARDAHRAFVAHHNAGPQDCAVMPSIRPQFLTAVQRKTAAAGSGAMQNAVSQAARLAFAEIPPVIESAPSRLLSSVSTSMSLSSPILRV